MFICYKPSSLTAKIGKQSLIGSPPDYQIKTRLTTCLPPVKGQQHVLVRACWHGHLPTVYVNLDIHLLEKCQSNLGQFHQTWVHSVKHKSAEVWQYNKPVNFFSTDDLTVFLCFGDLRIEKLCVSKLMKSTLGR